MNWLRKSMLFLFCTCFLAPPGSGEALADTVIIENGDRLTGTVIRLEEGKHLSPRQPFRVEGADPLLVAVPAGADP